MTRTLAGLLVATLCALAGQAQTLPPVSDPQALTLAAQSIGGWPTLRYGLML